MKLVFPNTVFTTYFNKLEIGEEFSPERFVYNDEPIKLKKLSSTKAQVLTSELSFRPSTEVKIDLSPEYEINEKCLRDNFTKVKRTNYINPGGKRDSEKITSVTFSYKDLDFHIWPQDIVNRNEVEAAIIFIGIKNSVTGDTMTSRIGLRDNLLETLERKVKLFYPEFKIECPE